MDSKLLDSIVLTYKDDIVSTLQRWVRQPSLEAPRSGDNAPFGADVRKMLDIALEDCKAQGFEVRDFDGYAMDVQLGKGEKTMGILCHLDVVPAGDGWTMQPWGGEIENNRIYGRGTSDDKGPAVAALFAMKAVREAGIPLKDGVRLILGCNEETGMEDMRYYNKVAEPADYGFSPDAEYPVINIEKGGMTIVLSASGCGKAENGISVYSMNAGERVNVVPGTAAAEIGAADESALKAKLAEIAKNENFELKLEKKAEGRFVLTAIGKSSHASMPELGKNAAGMLFITLEKLNAGGSIYPAIKVIAEKLGLESDGAGLGLNCKDELSGALTCNLGLLRYDGEKLIVTLDCRTPICADFEKLSANATVILAGTPVSYTLAHSRTYLHVPADHKVVKGLIKAYSEVTGKEGYTIAIGGGTYSRCMPNTVASGINFPGDPDLAHMPDEYVDIDRLMTATRIMARAIAELAG